RGELDAPSFCRRLQAQAGGDRATVLVVLAPEQDPAPLLASGAHDFVAAPLTPSLLSARLGILEREVQRRERAEQALRESEDLSGTVLHAVVDGIITI